MCLISGHVGYCDSSPGKHGTALVQETGHPLIQPVFPDGDWRWCDVDEVAV